MNNCCGPIQIFTQGPGGTTGSAAIARPSIDALSTPFLVAKDQTTLTIKANTYVKIINAGAHTIRSFDVDTDVVVATALDVGAIAAGLDYYVYLCDDGAVKVSLASTFPAGYTANNSRKIGGFHSLCCAVGTIAGHTLTTFATSAILPQSVWCLNHRTRGKQEGTVWDDKAKVWPPIYMISGTGAATESAYGATITDSRNWMDLADDLAAVGWRHSSDEEFASAAAGSNEKTNVYGSSDPVTCGKSAIYLSKTGTWAAGVPTSAWINRTAYVPPVLALNEAQEYEITISTGHAVNPNFFTYRKRNPAGAYGAASDPIQITGAAQALADGLTIAFPAALGWVTAETANFVVMNGLVDTANRRTVSNIGCEAMCGVMWQWLRDQSYRFDRGSLTFITAALTTPITHAAAPEGQLVYLKYSPSGIPYLCCNMATDTADKIITFGTAYTLRIVHDANAAVGSYQVYFDEDATQPARLLAALPGLKNEYLHTSNPMSFLQVTYNAAPATPGVAIYFDDVTLEKLLFISPTATAAPVLDLATTHTEPAWGWTDLGSNKGSLYKQGAYGDVKLLAGGHWGSGTPCGSRCRDANHYRWNTIASLGARGCAEPM